VNITEQVLELAGPAWLNEPRDPHSGEWVKMLRSMSPAEKRTYVKSGILPERLSQVHPSAPPPRQEPTSGGKLEGLDLWMSGEGAVSHTTEGERKAARDVWYRDTFSYTNDYLRHGVVPSVSAVTAKRSAQSSYGTKRLDLPVASDKEYIAEIKTMKNMMDRAPAFSRPAVMYRDVTSPDQVFGAAGSMEGRVFTDHGFMSATTDKHTAEQYGGEEGPSDKIIINVPAGGKVMRSSRDFSPDYAREKEYTFPPGSSFRVDSDRIVNGQRETTVTLVIPPGGAKPGPRPKPITAKTAVHQQWEAYPGSRYNIETGELV
jgi:hypothetical protein